MLLCGNVNLNGEAILDTNVFGDVVDEMVDFVGCFCTVADDKTEGTIGPQLASVSRKVSVGALRAMPQTV